MTTKLEEKVTRVIEDGPLFQLLGAENVDRIKTEITNAIINQVVRDLEDNEYYLLPLDEMAANLTEELIRDVRDAIKPKLEEALYKATLAKLGLANEEEKDEKQDI